MTLGGSSRIFLLETALSPIDRNILGSFISEINWEAIVNTLPFQMTGTGRLTRYKFPSKAPLLFGQDFA